MITFYCRWCLCWTVWLSSKLTKGHQRETCQEDTKWVITPADSFCFSVLYQEQYISLFPDKLKTKGDKSSQDKLLKSTSQGWPVLGCCKPPQNSLCLMPNLPTEWHPPCPPCPVVCSAPRRLLQLSGHLWTSPWVLSPAVPPVCSPIPWRLLRPACSSRESCARGDPTRDTTEESCRLFGWWAARTGSGACRRGSQSGWSTRAWWMEWGWGPTPTVKLWVSPRSTGGVCCQGQQPGRWVPSLPLLPTW